MDPVSVIVSAVALGASSGLKATAAAAVKDGYAALKRLLSHRYPGVDLTPVETKPSSEPKRGSLEEDLQAVGAGTDDEVLAAARRLIAAVKEHSADTGPALGIDIERVWAASIDIEDVAADGTAVRMRDVSLSGDMRIKGVRAGGGAEKDPSAR